MCHRGGIIWSLTDKIFRFRFSNAENLRSIKRKNHGRWRKHHHCKYLFYIHYYVVLIIGIRKYNRKYYIILYMPLASCMSSALFLIHITSPPPTSHKHLNPLIIIIPLSTPSQKLSTRSSSSTVNISSGRVATYWGLEGNVHIIIFPFIAVENNIIWCANKLIDTHAGS